MKKLIRSFVPELKKRIQQDKSFIQVVLGPRQVGKTTGVWQVFEQLLKVPKLYTSSDEQLNPNPLWLEQQWQKALEISKDCILAIDEIQKVPHWSSVIKKLWDEQQRKKNSNIRLILLGSASLSLQKGLVESLTGRYEILRVYHWNFYETLNLTGWNLETYLKYGGYPASYKLIQEPHRFREYILQSIIETVIGKDILHFSRVKSPSLFRQAFEILSQYPASEISYNKLLGQLQEKGNVDLIKYYIELYEGAFLVKTLQKYSPKIYLKKSSSPKVLLSCPSLVTALGYNPDSSENQGHLFELCVGNELLQLDPEVTYWRDANLEVDYVLHYRQRVFGIEVKSGRIKNSKGLESFQKKYPKTKILFITPDNFLNFSKNPKAFLDKFI